MGTLLVDIAWNYEKRNRGPLPLCNNSLVEGYWTAADGMPASVHATSPYMFPGGGIAGAEQHPFCESNGYVHQRKRKRFR